MATLLADLRHAVRVLWKDRRFTAVALVALALGIGATSAIYSVVDAVLLRPLPFPDSGSLVEIQSALRNGGGVSSYPDFVDFRARNHSLTAIAAYTDTQVVLTGGANPRQVAALEATPSLLRVLGVRPLLGRAFVDGDAVIGSQAVIIAHALWQGRYRGDPEVIGRSIFIDGKPAVIVGVMPPGFRYPVGVGDAAPLVYLPYPRDESDLSAVRARGMHLFTVVGRAAVGVSAAQAQADFDAVTATMRADHPSEREDKNLTVQVQALRERIVGPVRPALLLLLCAVVCVLVIACANVAGLLLARGTVRRREMAIRSTLGATRGRIVRQLLTESALVGVVGGGAGLLLALWLVDLLVALVAPDLPSIHAVNVDGRVLAVTAAVAVVSSIAFGIVPALHASRVDLQESLKEATRAASHASRRSRNALLVAEIAVALVLLFAAGLALRSFASLRAVDPGFRPHGLTVAQVDLPARYPKELDDVRYYRQLSAALASLPGADAVGLGAPLPFSHEGIRTSVHLPAQSPSPALSTARLQTVSPSYFAAMGIPLLAGRDFAAVDDDPKSAPTVVVSQDFARKLFPHDNPIGKHVDIGISAFDDGQAAPSTICEIVGVVGDTRRDSLERPVQPSMYLTLGRFPLGVVGVIVRSRAPEAMMAPLRDAILSLDHDLPPTVLATMDSLVGETVHSRQMLLTLLALFAATALALATIGIYGMMSYTVTQRRRELGIRIAVGAQRGQILRLVVGESLRLAALGVGIGVAGSLVVGRLGRSLVYGVSATDPLTLAAVALLLLAVSVGASLLPAWRATRVDPIETLRDD